MRTALLWMDGDQFRTPTRDDVSRDYRLLQWSMTDGQVQFSLIAVRVDEFTQDFCCELITLTHD